MNACGTPRGMTAIAPASSGAVLRAVDVQQDFALQHVERLVGVGVPMERRHLSRVKIIFEEQERATGLLRSGLPGVPAAAAEPALFPFAVRPDRDLDCLHVGSLSVVIAYGT